MSKAAAVALGLLAAACSAETATGPATNDAAEVAAPESTMPATTSTAAGGEAPAAGCVQGLRVEIDRGSFDPVAADPAPTDEQLEKLRVSAQAVFREAAARLCASGEIDRSELGGFTRLVIQNGEGADSTAVYTDAERFGEQTIIFQWTFAGGVERAEVPDASDVRDGLLCYFGSEEKYGEMCALRMP